jgi:hypothetical protein
MPRAKRPQHLRFPKMHTKTVVATKRYLDDNPTIGTPGQQKVKAQVWLETVSKVYGVPVPTIEGGAASTTCTEGRYRMFSDSFEVKAYDPMSVIHMFRHHLQANGHGKIMDDDEADAWAKSLLNRVSAGL